jgi:hypothetical protein
MPLSRRRFLQSSAAWALPALASGTAQAPAIGNCFFLTDPVFLTNPADQPKCLA